MNCPTCGKPMKPVTARTPEKAWRCEECEDAILKGKATT